MIRDILERVPLFQGLAMEELDLLARLFLRESFAAGSVVFEQGDPADRLYVLVSGQVQIQYRPYDGGVLTVAEILEGGVFGWSSVLGRKAYSSFALAVADSHALSIEGQTLRRLCMDHPQTGVLVMERLTGVIAERLRSTHEQVARLLWQGVNRPN
ncbi:MAG TPA: cyclic nucleotide-binding domain-containing protein [Anaerolineales bacterium]|nr:cyclic nucleotide-binding domain-containing protein [Anaerolineales bacterium]